jgi:hypothetical protein
MRSQERTFKLRLALSAAAMMNCLCFLRGVGAYQFTNLVGEFSFLNRVISVYVEVEDLPERHAVVCLHESQHVKQWSKAMAKNDGSLKKGRF